MTDIPAQGRPRAVAQLLPTILTLFGVAIVAAVAIYLSTMPVRWLLGYIPDDAFYYFGIARNIVHGRGATFDGINPTNGFQPAWMALVVLCAYLVHSSAGLVRGAMALSFACHIGAALAVTAFVRRMAGRVLGAVAGFTWLISPLAIQLTMQCMESAVAILSAALILWWRTVIADDDGASRSRLTGRAVIFGALLALATYARTDLAIFDVLALASLTIPWPTAAGQGVAVPKREERWRGAAIALVAWLVLFTPWLLCSHAITGSFLQDSEVMKALWHRRVIPHMGPIALASYTVRAVLSSWIGRSAAITVGLLASPESWLPACAAYIAGVALCAVAGWRSALKSAALQCTIWLGAYVLISGAAFSLSVDYIQIWHAAVAGLCLHLIAALWLLAAIERLLAGSARRIALAVTCAAPLILTLVLLSHDAATYPWQRDVYDTEPRFESLLPTQARIGCFNAGIPGYFSPRTIIALDGLVNHTAVPYWLTGRLNDYLVVARIVFVIDDQDGIMNADVVNGTPVPLRLLAEYQFPSGGARYLCRVVRLRARPASH